MKTKLSDLREHLFLSLENLNNPEKGSDMNLEIQKARVVADIGQVIVNSAKIESDFITKMIKEGYTIESEFLPQPKLRS